MFDPDEARRYTAQVAKNRLYGIVRELEAILEQNKAATDYWRLALFTRAEQLERDRIYWQNLYNRTRGNEK